MVDFDQINFILKLRIYFRLLTNVLLFLECYKNLLSKGVNILLGQPVHDKEGAISTRCNLH